MAATVTVVATVFGSLVLIAPAAQAAGKPWGTIYTRTSAGNAAAAHGDFANNGNVYATVGANWTDLRSGDGKAYVKVEFFFYKNQKWESAGSSESAHTSTSASGPLSRRLRVDASAARAAIKVCIESIFVDPCSPEAILSFNY
ncbi:hypothetical protein [Actinokineospora sp. NBRC 105648]|uniref:hypothetical protein n=1 Tax=Actinokineospora sp. NBRC 105648 TaxID=3032206 RepID=UPI0024A3EECB|nr:hypothetical protein [Actinokineospora sp. NBRC 105648]GLZ41605.1 hypothetical protein Acsp05_52290 [Actinokineospora sp. NBRC 105648]